jgi:hypothetical protein
MPPRSSTWTHLVRFENLSDLAKTAPIAAQLADSIEKQLLARVRR